MYHGVRKPTSPAPHSIGQTTKKPEDCVSSDHNPSGWAKYRKGKCP